MTAEAPNDPNEAPDAVAPASAGRTPHSDEPSSLDAEASGAPGASSDPGVPATVESAAAPVPASTPAPGPAPRTLPSTTFGRPVIAPAAVGPSDDGTVTASGTDAPRTSRAEAARAARAPVDVAAVGERLRARFPAAFSTPPKPLKLRIHADIQQRAPGEFGRRELSLFFARLTAWGEYLRALADSTHRVDLDGADAEPVADEHRQAARDELERRRERRQQRWAPGLRPVAPGSPGAPGATAQPVPPPAAGADAQAAADPVQAGGPRPPAGPPSEGPRGPRPARADGGPRGERRPRPERSGPPHAGARGERGERGERRPDAPVRPAHPSAPPRPIPAGRPLPGPAGRTARPDGRGPTAEPRRPFAQASGHPGNTAAPERGSTAPPRDPERFERARLLRDFEGSPLSAANFCVLKGLDPGALDALLAQARRERDEARRG